MNLERNVLRRIAMMSLLLAATCGAAQERTAGERPGYLTPDGSVRIVGDAALGGVVEGLNRLFARRHPETRFELVLDSSNNIGLAGITFGESPFSALSRKAYPLEVRPFVQTHHHLPLDIVVGHLGCAGPKAMPLPGLYVNASAPPFSLTWVQVGALLTGGGMPGDITRWEQIGVRQGWEEHAMHVYGPPDDGGFVSALRQESFDGRPLALRYEAMSSAAAVAEALRKDAYGIGLMEARSGSTEAAALRLVPIAKEEGSRPSAATCAEVRKGQYPFAVDLHFYLNRPTGARVDGLVRDYMEMVLSAEGQGVIARRRNAVGSYLLPLSEGELAAQRAKLD